MGLFDFFKRRSNNKSLPSTSDNGVVGPKHLVHYSKPIHNPKSLLEHEWRRQLIWPNGEEQFQLKYYGQRHAHYSNLVVGTDFAPTKLIAVHPQTQEEIVLFDGCKHGYNALFCDSYSKEQIQNRPTSTLYLDANGEDTFSIVISTYNGMDYNEEFTDFIESNGLVTLVDQSQISEEEAWSLCFDTLQISIINSNGHRSDIISEELA